MKEIVDRDKYSELFKGKERKALKTALDTRKFEIEMYWKRATYFWAFIAAIFAAYFIVATKKDASDYSNFFTIIISLLGYIFSLGWYFVNRGSKFWQSNWESHVAELENEIQGPLFRCVKIPKEKFSNLRGDYPFSVSKVNQSLSVLVTIFWMLIFVISVLHGFHLTVKIKNMFIDSHFDSSPILLVIFLSIFVLFFLLMFLKKMSHSFAYKELRIEKSYEPVFFLNKNDMNSRITMGNDELILYIRKKDKKCSSTNDQLGKKIWEWIQRNDEKALLIKEDDPCLWGDKIENKKGLGLPKTAAQLQFNRTLLPKLYEFLDTIL